jgi:glutamine amidotransferase
MCIIAAIPAGKQISKEVLKRCWENNPHGGGFMYNDGKQVLIFKEMVSFKRYYREFLNLRNSFPNSSFVCHFRISTHGKINTDNCHPFHVNKKLGFVHNGVISKAPLSLDFSDTFMFNETILKNLPSNFLSNYSIMALIADYIGLGSKLTFLTNDNKLVFVNESAGVWDDGIWFSNKGYKASKYYDMGGVKVANIGTKNKTENKAQSNSKFDFASTAFPKQDVFTSKIITEDVNNYSRWKQSYQETCIFCDRTINTHFEKSNQFCIQCCDKYEQEWAL